MSAVPPRPASDVFSSLKGLILSLAYHLKLWQLEKRIWCPEITYYPIFDPETESCFAQYLAQLKKEYRELKDDTKKVYFQNLCNKAESLIYEIRKEDVGYYLRLNIDEHIDEFLETQTRLAEKHLEDES